MVAVVAWVLLPLFVVGIFRLTRWAINSPYKPTTVLWSSGAAGPLTAAAAQPSGGVYLADDGTPIEPAYRYPGLPAGQSIDGYVRDGLTSLRIHLIQQSRSTENG